MKITCVCHDGLVCLLAQYILSVVMLVTGSAHIGAVCGQPAAWFSVWAHSTCSSRSNAGIVAHCAQSNWPGCSCGIQVRVQNMNPSSAVGYMLFNLQLTHLWVAVTTKLKGT